MHRAGWSTTGTTPSIEALPSAQANGVAVNLAGKTALVLGGTGLVGQAVCRELMGTGLARLLVAGLTEREARAGVTALEDDRSAAAAAHATELVPVWGNVFVRAGFAYARPRDLRADPVHRAQLLADALDALDDDVYRSSHLVQLVLGESELAPGHRPHVIVDAVNTATALAYGGLFETIRRVLAEREEADTEVLAGEVDALLGSFAIPPLVRHVQLLSAAMREAETEAYIKVGTTGTGGMGLNIPYTHGEERPSRVLLSKTALAGAHTMLLFLIARTPDAPVVKEVKPAAAITWKRIAYGPIAVGRQPLGRYDCSPDEAVALQPGQPFDLNGAGQALSDTMESVYIDTGENGLFSLGEYEAITALGQMEAVTPEEIASSVVREIRGQSTGRDVLGAIGSAVMGPSYRAGQLRTHALAEARALAEAHDVPSVAFEILGPPRLSKLLYEAALLRHAFGSLDALAEAKPDTVADAFASAVSDAPDLRQAAISVGIAVLMPDGRTVLAAERQGRQHDWERTPWTVDAEAIERRAKRDWIDLRPKNAARWRERAAAMVAERDAEQASGRTSSGLDRRFVGDPFPIGEAVAWIFINEEGGRRAQGLP